MVINDILYTSLKKKLKLKLNSTYIFSYINLQKRVISIFFSPFRAIQIIFGSCRKMSFPFYTERDKSATNALSFIKPHRGPRFNLLVSRGEKRFVWKKNQYLTTFFDGKRWRGDGIKEVSRIFRLVVKHIERLLNW